MQPTNVRVEYSVEATINLGNFQNVRPGYRISADVPEGVHPNEVREKLKALGQSWLEQDAVEAIKEKNE